MSATARTALRACIRPQVSARVNVTGTRVRMASTHAQSTTRTNATGRISAVSAVIASGIVIGSFAYARSPVRMESNPEKAKRQSYANRMQPKTERGSVGGGESSGKAKSSATSDTQKDSERSEDHKQEQNESEEGERQQKQDDARQSVDDSNTLPLDDLESEASQQSAFDPETNTINWDCPCLGGMAHGPCGDEFKEAFSCFVFSEKEPKGIECVEKFKGMQDCFRKYPEHYREELEDDEEYENHDGETLEKRGEEHLASNAGGEEEEDDGLKEWRSELAKESKN